MKIPTSFLAELQSILQEMDVKMIKWLIWFSVIAIAIILAICLIVYLLSLNDVSRKTKKAFQLVNSIFGIIAIFGTLLGFVYLIPNLTSKITSILITYGSGLATVISITFGSFLHILNQVPEVCKEKIQTLDETYRDVDQRLTKDNGEESYKKKIQLYRSVLEKYLKNINSFLSSTSSDDRLIKNELTIDSNSDKDIDRVLSIGEETFEHYFLMAHFGESVQNLLARSIHDVYSQTHNVFIESLFSNKPSVPDFFAHTYDDAILQLKMTEQRCTSLYGLKRFYDFYHELGLTINEKSKYERIFILDDDAYEQISPNYVLVKNQLEDLNRVLEFLSKFNVNVKFISQAKAKGIQQRMQNSPTFLDFSISTIPGNKHIVLSLGSETVKKFFDKEVLFYELDGRVEESDGSTCRFYEELSANATDSKSFVNNTFSYWISQAPSRAEKTKLKSTKQTLLNMIDKVKIHINALS